MASSKLSVYAMRQIMRRTSTRLEKLEVKAAPEVPKGELVVQLNPKDDLLNRMTIKAAPEVPEGKMVFRMNPEDLESAREEMRPMSFLQDEDHHQDIDESDDFDLVDVDVDVNEVENIVDQVVEGFDGGDAAENVGDLAKSVSELRSEILRTKMAAEKTCEIAKKLHDRLCMEKQ